jgi:hypothetical protein
LNDLYRRIGLPGQTNDRAAIERAIAAAERSDAKIAQTARHVLLDHDRKVIYDRTRNVVLLVGQLRANLGQSRAPNWLASNCADFDAKPTSSISQLEMFYARQKSASVNKKMPSTGAALVLVLLLLCASPFVVVSLFKERSTNPPVSATAQAGPALPDRPTSTLEAIQLPLLSVETREDRARELVTKRLAHSGKTPDPSVVDKLTQKLIQAKADADPATGVLTRSFKAEGVAPLEIKTRGGANYYIKVVDWTTKAEMMTVFIRGGEPFETMVPVGSYEIKYAAGQSWYGPILDFGENASYARCDERFDFSRTADGFSGYTLELILQQNGNLATDPISVHEF